MIAVAAAVTMLAVQIAAAPGDAAGMVRQAGHRVGDGCRSNAAIAGKLFVTEKAISKHINSIFTKLGLPVSDDDNRRVLAVLARLNS
jgi:hypothetical protein